MNLNVAIFLIALLDFINDTQKIDNMILSKICSVLNVYQHFKIKIYIIIIICHFYQLKH